ncbi:MAG: CPBP family intramembrane glutamic endopeptidase [Saprospiraceae bacterium]|nr:CPBP family intramembrane glutamic endopeptidase [Saprospiraceae bacterium]
MSIFSLLFIGLQLIVLPLLSFQSRTSLEEAEEIPPRRALYIQSIIMLTVIGGLAALVDWRESLEIYWFKVPNLKSIFIAVGLYMMGLIVSYFNFKSSQNNEEDKSAILLPAGKNEYLIWVVLCLTAAWSEEYIYRGVLSQLFIHHGMIYILAILLSAVSFAFSHFTQGWLAIPVTFVFALGFQYLYQVSGSLALPIAVHFLYNVSAEGVRRWLIGRSGGI